MKPIQHYAAAALTGLLTHDLTNEYVVGRAWNIARMMLEMDREEHGRKFDEYPPVESPEYIIGELRDCIRGAMSDLREGAKVGGLHAGRLDDIRKFLAAGLEIGQKSDS